MSPDQTTQPGTQRSGSSLPSTVAADQCGACQTVNAPESKFCAGCGQSLVEPCAGCNEPVLLTQKFCGSCGSDLESTVKERIAKNERLIADAVGLVKQGDFDPAILILKQLTKSDDYRLADSVQQGKQALERVIKLRDRNEAEVEKLATAAFAAAERNDHERVIALLGKIPENGRSEEVKKLYRQSKSTVEQLESLNASLQTAMKDRDWKMLGLLVNQLLGLAPENANYQQIAVKVSQRLLSSAQKLADEQEYERAGEFLESVPDCQRGADFESLSSGVVEMRWLASEVDAEPFVSTGLGRLAVRLAKQCPGESNQARVKELAALIKTVPANRNGVNDWKGDRQSWIGGDLAVLGQLTQVEVDDAARRELLQRAGLFNVAVGLAIQGVGAARVSESFLPSKKGLLKSLSRRKASAAWGVDIGSSGLRAVLLSHTADGAKIESVFAERYETPACRAVVPGESVQSGHAGVVDALKKFDQHRSMKNAEASVWINLPSGEVVNRSVRLPPLKDKPAAQALQQETEGLLPLEASELAMVRWLADLDEDHSKGRPAVIAAARTLTVQRRLDLCEEAGISVDGIQSDAIALANLVACEFEDELSVAQSDDLKEPAIAMVDSGASATSLVIVTKRSVHIWSFDSGGEELTKTLARESKKTLADSDALKQDPASMPNAATLFEAMEPKMHALRQRLERAMTSLESGGTRPVVLQTWVAGGNVRCHGWLRNVLGK